MEDTAKILLLGKTGAGKSAFVNYFLGRDVATVGVGKPVTQETFIPYRVNEGHYPVEIFDTKGLEALHADRQVEEIVRDIRERNGSQNVFNWFHTIFYCVSMANPRFEDFEAEFIRELQRVLTQHIHIILTHCDMAGPEAIRSMRSRITQAIGHSGNVEIFEVVSVDMRKRNGTMVHRSGKEHVSERVFDLLLEDIANRLASRYAEALWWTMYDIANGAFADISTFLDETFRVATVWDAMQGGDVAKQRMERIDMRLNEIEAQVWRRIGQVTKEKNEQFARILRPIGEFYTSYWGIATDTYVQDAELSFMDTLAWVDTDTLGTLDSDKLTARTMPHLKARMKVSATAPQTLVEVFGLAVGSAVDLINLRKNARDIVKEMRQEFVKGCLPTQEALQAKARDQIIAYIKGKKKEQKAAAEHGS